MSIRVKIDEDLPGEIAEFFRTAGHDARTVLDENLQGTDDERLWSVLQNESRCLVTADRGFADARRYLHGTHAGVILFRLPQESRAGYLRLANSLIADFDLEKALGAIVVVTPCAVRIHRSE